MSGKIAIVGAGPSGCFLAQALLNARPELEVDIIDKLPVPYGLVRYGVAADHQGTKAVMRQFARVFERQGARFVGNVELGRDLALEDLRMAYDAVVLAVGLYGDRKLGVSGDNLNGVIGAGRLTRALYDHPDAEPLPDLGPNPVIIGNGNVAIDILRLLAKQENEFDGTDLGRTASDWLARSGIERITIVGRSPAASAKFDPVMIKELGKLQNARIEMSNLGECDDADGQKKLDALATISGHASGACVLDFRFGLTPKFVGGKVQAASVCFTTAAGEEIIDCSSVITAIGFEDNGTLSRQAMIKAADDVGSHGLYLVGWFCRGPRGTIPENRTDAKDLATRILDDLTVDSAKVGNGVFDELKNLVDYHGWVRINAIETDAKIEGRCRTKVATRSDLLYHAKCKELP